MIGTISAGPYAGVKPPIELPSVKPLEVSLGYIGDCPEPGETYDGFLSFQFSVGGPHVGCSYSFNDKKWDCDAGFVLEKITEVSVDAKGGISYEKVIVF